MKLKSKPQWYSLYKAEYKSMTARFSKKRYSLPIILLVGALLLVISIHFLVNILFDLFAQLSESTQTIQELRIATLQDNSDFFFLNVFLNTFLAFFIPISIPLGRIESEGGKIDALISAPITNRDIFLGNFFAELTLIVPFLCTFTAGLVAISTLAPLDTLIIAFTISFFLLFLNAAIGLWLGIFIARFVLKKVNRTLITLNMAVLSLFLLYATDTILKYGVKGVLNNILLLLIPSTLISLLIFSFAFQVSFGPSFEILSAILLSIFIIVIILIVLNAVNRIHLSTSNRSSSVKLTPKIEERQIISYNSRLMFYRYIRDPESIARFILTLVFTIIVYYVFSSILGEIPSSESTFNKLFWIISFFLSLIGTASILIYTTAAYFSIEFMEMLEVLLSIPNSIRKLNYLKLFQLIEMSLPMIVFVILITNIIAGLSPFNILQTALLIFIASIGLSSMLLGIFGLNPVSDENDIMHIINALIFFFLIIIIELVFSIIVLLSGINLDNLFFVYLIAMCVVLSIGILIFFIGVENQVNIDISNKKGIYTDRFLALGRIMGGILICWIAPVLPAILVYIILSWQTLLAQTNPFFVNIIIAIGVYYFLAGLFTKLITRSPKDDSIYNNINETTIKNKALFSSLSLAAMYGLVLILVIWDSSLLNTTVYVSNYVITFLLRSGVIPIVLTGSILLLGVIVEELFFREYLVQNFEEFTLSTSVYLSAIIFALLHFPVSLLSFAFYLLMGLILVKLYVNTKFSLLSVIVVHFTYNISIILILSFL